MIRIAFYPFFTCRPIDLQRSYTVTSVASGRCIEIRMVLFRLYVWNFAMAHNEDLDYFSLCSTLNSTPELMSFKLYSLTKRGQAYHMPMEIQSNFLAK